MLYGWRSDTVPDKWPKVKGHIDRGLSSDYTLEQVYNDLTVADAQLWTWETDDVHAALVTKIEEFPDGKRFCLLLSAGGCRVHDWKSQLPVVEDWAKSEGCVELRIYGRRGWLRVLDGFKEREVTMVKAL